MSGGGNSRMSSHCELPNWYNILLKHQRQEQVQGDEQLNTSSHHHNSVTYSHFLPIPMSNNLHQQVKDLTWENGPVAKHGLVASCPPKPTWARSGGTLESVVHQGTSCNNQLNPNTSNATLCAPAGKWVEKPIGSETRKRARSDFDNGPTKNFTRGNNNEHKMKEEKGRPSGCASASATFCRESDTTMLTWASFESFPRSLNLNDNKPTDEDSVSLGCLNHDEDVNTKGESGRTNSTRRSRAAAVHNLSERRRRDRINQKMKALQKLVPNASKTDKASMLDEVIEYLKQLQGQVQIMTNFRNNMATQAQAQAQAQAQQAHALAPPAAHMNMNMMMVPLGIQQHMNMWAAAAAMAHSLAGPTFLPMLPQSQTKHAPSSSTSYVPSPDPYTAFLAQSMNMELYNKMAAFYSQRANQSPKQGISSPSRSSQLHADS